MDIEIPECNLWRYPVTDEEKSLRYNEYVHLRDQLEFEEAIVARRRIQWMERRLKMLEKNQQQQQQQ